jgi:hypothetical protein
MGHVDFQERAVGRLPILNTQVPGEATCRATLNGSLTIIVLTPLTTFSVGSEFRVQRGTVHEVFEFVGV